MDMDLINKSSLLMLLWLMVLGIIACTSKTDVRIPPFDVMHFPFTMALSGKYLAVSSASTDGKYDYGRLVVLDTVAIKKAIDAKNTNKEPIAWQDIVMSNFLVSPEVGEIIFSNDVAAFVSQQSGVLTAIPIDANGKADCASTETKAEMCRDARVLPMVADEDPFGIQNMPKGSDTFLVSYLNSDRIDLVKIDKSKIELLKSFKGYEWARKKVKIKDIEKQRLVTKKIYISAADAKVYFLFNRYKAKNKDLSEPKGSYIVAISEGDLMAPSLGDDKIDLWDLAELASIDNSQDLYVDKTEAYLLTNESLYKIELKPKNKPKLINNTLSCTKPISMAVSNAKNLIVVPCFKDNQVVSYDMPTLSIKNTSEVVGRGPAYCVIDDDKSYIYCTYYNDGTLAIFDMYLKYLGHAFNRAPFNRVGS